MVIITHPYPSRNVSVFEYFLKVIVKLSQSLLLWSATVYPQNPFGGIIDYSLFFGWPRMLMFSHSLIAKMLKLPSKNTVIVKVLILKTYF